MVGPVNPANVPEKSKVERKRIPMSVPLQKLAVPDLPGYHLHWFVSGRVNRALAGGYEFVDPTEVEVLGTGVADDSSMAGSTDMGSRISVSAGETLDENGNEQRLYLMKLREALWQEDQKVLADRNESIAAAIRGGSVGVESEKDPNRYIPEGHRRGVENLFTPKHRKA